jgi:hypothetical protein
MNQDQAHALDQELAAYQQSTRRHNRADHQPTTPESTNWLRFAAATGATLASGSVCDAAITHVIPSQPIRAELLAAAEAIDLDGDFDDDFEIGAGVFASGIYYTFVGGADAIANDFQLIGDQLIRNEFVSIKKFTEGAVIPAVAPAQVGSILHSMLTAYSYPVAQYANWSTSETGIAGFVQGPAGSRRAGWIKIRTEAVGNRLSAVEVLEWAFESVPGISIAAGQTSSGSVPGDYNGNGTVGPEDYTLWKNTFGTSVTAGTGADGNENAKIDAGDYTVWRDNLGASGSASAVNAVPEPATVSLGVLALGAMGISALRRR